MKRKIVVVFMMVWMAWFSNVVFCIEDTLPTSNIGVTQNGQLSFGGGYSVREGALFFLNIKHSIFKDINTGISGHWYVDKKSKLLSLYSLSGQKDVFNSDDDSLILSKKLSLHVANFRSGLSGMILRSRFFLTKQVDRFTFSSGIGFPFFQAVSNFGYSLSGGLVTTLGTLGVSYQVNDFLGVCSSLYLDKIFVGVKLGGFPLLFATSGEKLHFMIGDPLEY